MNPARLFILRPVATSLLMLALLLCGALAYRLLPVSALPEVDYPIIQVSTLYPGASPTVMTALVTSPLERQFGQMPGLNRMSSTSSGGASVITLQFTLDLALDVAEQQVQAAINAAGSFLPQDLPMPPVYSKVNPADAPIVTLAITSDTLPLPRIQELIDTRVAQKLSQISGVGLVSIAGGVRPAVRVQANPLALAAAGISLEDVRNAIAAANVNGAKGSFDGPTRASTLDANDQLRSVEEYRALIVAWKNGAAIRLGSVADVVEGAENARLAAWSNERRAIILNVQRQPGANVIETVDRIQAMLPRLQASLPGAVQLSMLSDRTVTIRAALRDVQFELVLAVALVVLVIFLFLRSVPATLIPAAAVPLSLVGTFAVMALAGFSLNNLTLMALTIATGFVVDDAIVMIENITRHIEQGEPPLQAALKGAQQIGFESVPIEQATTYSAEDADVALQLHGALWPKLAGDNRLRAVYTELELPLIEVLSRIERTGAFVDGPALTAFSAELAVRIDALRERACELAGEPFNPDSPKQLQAILYEKQKLPILSKTPKGQPSTAEAALEVLAEDFELPRLILEYRGLAKLRSTYAERLPAEINARTGRIHTSYHQAVTATGRLSSSEPNLQNIPVRTAEGRRIRQAFVAPPGRRILAADYSQIELRIMAHLSGDQGLLQAFALGQDVHRRTAAEVFNESLDTVTDEQRRSAKAINFGLIYGMSAFGLAKQLGVSRTLAQDYIDRYFARYPGVRDYMERTRAQAREQGYVETLFGRRLHVPEIHAGNQARRQAAERTAINAPMQGSAADIIKRAMIDVDRWLTASAVDALMIMQVHDELVFEVAEGALPTVTQNVSVIMSEAARLQVPLVVDVGVGSNWDEAH